METCKMQFFVLYVHVNSKFEDKPTKYDLSEVAVIAA